jgi:hypothetical protein
MTQQFPSFEISDGDWICGKCGIAPVQQKVRALYMEGAFELSLPVCPECGQYFISKELAEGKMLQVEKLQEDK